MSQHITHLIRSVSAPHHLNKNKKHVVFKIPIMEWIMHHGNGSDTQIHEASMSKDSLAVLVSLAPQICCKQLSKVSGSGFGDLCLWMMASNMVKFHPACLLPMPPQKPLTKPSVKFFGCLQFIQLPKHIKKKKIWSKKIWSLSCMHFTIFPLPFTCVVLQDLQIACMQTERVGAWLESQWKCKASLLWL